MRILIFPDKIYGNMLGMVGKGLVNSSIETIEK